jgi:hypothetical protein
MRRTASAAPFHQQGSPRGITTLKQNHAEVASHVVISRILKRPEMHSKLQFRDFETFQKYFKQLKPKFNTQTLAGRRKTTASDE